MKRYDGAIAFITAVLSTMPDGPELSAWIEAMESWIGEHRAPTKLSPLYWRVWDCIQAYYIDTEGGDKGPLLARFKAAYPLRSVLEAEQGLWDPSWGTPPQPVWPSTDDIPTHVAAFIPKKFMDMAGYTVSW